MLKVLIFRSYRGAGETLKKTTYVIAKDDTKDLTLLLMNQGFDITILKPSSYILGINRQVIVPAIGDHNNT